MNIVYSKITAIIFVAVLCAPGFAVAGEDRILKDIFIGRYSVPGTACPFFSDVKDMSLFTDYYQKNRPIKILIPEGVNSIMLDVRGETGNCEKCDDSEIITTLENYARKGISPLTAPINSLVGVFLNDSPPNKEQMPHVLKNAGKRPNPEPLLQQVFFIYHPMTSECHVLSVDLPEGASRFYLGVLDVYRWGDNTGDYSVTVRGTQLHSDVEPKRMSFLPKIILRPSVEIYTEPDEQSGVIYTNSDSFQVYPVHSRPDIKSDAIAVEEWCEIKSDDSASLSGWVKKKDVFEWRLPLCVAYETDSKRKPVLVFEDVKVLRHWINADARKRSESAETCYDRIESGNIPLNFPIIATESANTPSIEKHFYFIPILEYAFINIEKPEGRILKIAASAKGCRPVSGAEHHSPSRSAPDILERICGRMGDGESVDLIGWVSEKDLVDPDIQSIDVRVLLDRRQFDALTTTMQEVMTACRISLISGEPLIATLRSIPSVASRGGIRIQHAASLVEAAILPKFLYELPYQSRLATLGDELWSRWSFEENEQFLEEIDAKLRLYKAIIENPNGWVALNWKDEHSKYVYPLSLKWLP